MNVVEAIDQWIDANIDGLDDAELDSMLDVLDAIAVHELAEFDTNHLSDDEFDEICQTFDDAQQRGLADQMISNALMATGRVLEPREADDTASSVDDAELTDNEASEPTPEPIKAEPIEEETADVDDDVAPNLLGQSELPLQSETDPTEPIEPARAPTDANNLAPRFLGSTDVAPEPARSSTTVRVIVLAVVAAAVGAFALGALSLFNSLEVEAPEITREVVTDSSVASTPESEPNVDAIESEPEPTLGISQPDPTSEPEPPETEPTPQPEVASPDTAASLTAFVLDDGGDVYASLLGDSTATEAALIFDADEERGLPRAAALRAWGGSLAIITETGEVQVGANPDQSPSVVMWDSNTFSPARDAALIDGTNVILTAEGSILAFEGTQSPNTDEPRIIWDETPASSLSTNGTTLVAVLDLGDVLLWESLDDEPQRLWAAEGTPRALAAQVTTTTVVIGLDGGRVQRHQIDPLDTEGELVWDGAAADEPWALEFAAAENQTALVLDSYEVVVVAADSSRSVVWDGSEGLPAPVDLTVLDDELAVLLDTGSVVRLSTAGEATEQSIWDVSSGNVPPARQPLLVDPSSGN